MENPVEPKSKWRTPLHPLWPMSLRATLISFGVLFGVLVLGFMFPSPGCGVTDGRLTQALSNSRQIHLAWQRAVLDASATGNPVAIYAPFESKIKSTHQFLLRLDDGDYLPKSATEKVEKGLLLTNFSADDPADTVILISHSMVQNGKLLSKPSDGKNGFVVFFKRGDGDIYKSVQISQLRLPPRTPVFLDP